MVLVVVVEKASSLLVEVREVVPHKIMQEAPVVVAHTSNTDLD